jgi:hypothetical protein
MALDIDEKETVETIPTEGRVIYEQDLRAGSHSNGWASDMVEPTVDGPSGPTDVEEGDHKHLPEKPEPPRLVVGLLYLGAGTILIYAGVVVLRDWRKGKK